MCVVLCVCAAVQPFTHSPHNPPALPPPPAYLFHGGGGQGWVGGGVPLCVLSKGGEGRLHYDDGRTKPIGCVSSCIHSNPPTHSAPTPCTHRIAPARLPSLRAPPFPPQNKTDSRENGHDVPGQDGPSPSPPRAGPKGSSRRGRQQTGALVGQGRDSERDLYQPRGRRWVGCGLGWVDHPSREAATDQCLSVSFSFSTNPQGLRITVPGRVGQSLLDVAQMHDIELESGCGGGGAEQQKKHSERWTEDLFGRGTCVSAPWWSGIHRPRLAAGSLSVITSLSLTQSPPSRNKQARPATFAT